MSFFWLDIRFYLIWSFLDSVLSRCTFAAVAAPSDPNTTITTVAATAAVDAAASTQTTLLERRELGLAPPPVTAVFAEALFQLAVQIAAVEETLWCARVAHVGVGRALRD